MTKLLEFKEKLNNLYIKFGKYMRPALKFIIAFTVFIAINNYIGYDQRLNNLLVVVALSVFCAFVPSEIMVLAAAILSCAHVYYSSPILFVVVLLLFAILYFLIIRFMPNSGYIILAMSILFIMKIPYVIPVLLGLIATPVAIVPVTCGVIVYYLFGVIKNASLITGSSSVDDILEIFRYVVDSLFSNKEMLVIIVAFIVVLLVTYNVRKLSIDYAFNIAILAGVVTNVLALLIGNLVINVSNKVIYTLVGSLISGVIVLVIQFFRLNLDYSTVEYTQFEDDDYYYYVKAVPKVKIAAPKKDVKRINARKNDDVNEDRDLGEMEDDELR